MKNKYIYFPSFSNGVYGAALKRNALINGKLPVRYYDENYPENYRHKTFLITAGHHYKMENVREQYGLTDDVIVMGDSGGYQISSGAMKWSDMLRDKIFNWLEGCSDIAINLDIPPRMKMSGKFNECLELSVSNFDYFHKNQSGNTEFLNVLHGSCIDSYGKWYDGVSKFEFDGWSVGGTIGDSNNMFSAIYTLIKNKEHLNLNNKYLHFLGATRIIDFLLHLQLQKSLNEVGSNITVTSDSSSADRSVVFGTYFTGFNIKNIRFETIHLPDMKHHPDVIKRIVESGNYELPQVTNFDEYLTQAYNWKDVYDWGYGDNGVNYEYRAAMTNHNFSVFQDAIKQMKTLINGDRYILEQMVSKDVWQLLQSVDELVKTDDPKQVYNKYIQVYNKVFKKNKNSKVNNTFF
jgi:hypothetical protein